MAALGVLVLATWMATRHNLQPDPPSVQSGRQVAEPVALAAEVTPPPGNTLLPDRRPDQPDVEITPDHQLSRVRHKDASGLVPIERVETPEGTVEIRRTFRSSDGTLLKEEAFLNDKPVPVPVVPGK